MSWEKIAQLDEQANQSCPPLKVPTNDLRMVPGYSNLGDYLPDDVHYEFLEVDEHKYQYGKPLVKDERSLTTMMRRFHGWYMKTSRESDGMNTLTLRVKEEHDLVGIDARTPLPCGCCRLLRRSHHARRPPPLRCRWPLLPARCSPAASAARPPLCSLAAASLGRPVGLRPLNGAQRPNPVARAR